MPRATMSEIEQRHNILKAATKTRDRRSADLAAAAAECDRELDYQNSCVVEARLKWEEAVTAELSQLGENLERALLSLASIQKKLEPPSGPC